ncbi:hypothetical protein AB2B41_01070 [Marimonas sp. MJW-29]|uniref:Uncharacterized protein n=1 Tax=Sulfitobacter sediminis TaxID=3234186 RepID=A0ABV3RGZ6_9RHOB
MAPVLGAFLAGPASAVVLEGAIVRQTGNGQFVILDAGEVFAVGEDNFDDDNLYAFNEDQNIVLDRAIRVDIGAQEGLIPEGTTVASHYVFFDAVRGTHLGFVIFDAPILGVAAFQDTMAATDFLANNEVVYLSPELRGLEEGDEVWIDSDDPNKLWVFWSGSSPGDYIRVFTERSPGAMM